MKSYINQKNKTEMNNFFPKEIQNEIKYRTPIQVNNTE